MANENNNNNNNSADGGHAGNGGENHGNGNRRSSFTSNTFSALFGRSNSISQGAPATPSAPPSVSNASSSSRPARRMSITTLGLNAAGTSPISSSAAYFPSAAAGRDRRTSVSTASADSTSIDESAIEDDDVVGASAAQHAQSVPTTPYARRKSFGANGIFSGRGGPSPGTAPTSSHPSVSGSVSGSSTLFPIPARQQTHHESAPTLNSSPFVVKQRTTSMSKPALGPSGLSQGLGASGPRRTSLSGAPGVHVRHGSVSSVGSGATYTPQTFTGGPASVGGISNSLGRAASGRKPRTISDHPGSAGGNGLDWSEQFRSRAESTATRPAQHRASFGAAFSAGANGNNNTSPNAEARPMAIGGGGQTHQRAASIGDMSEPPKEMPKPKMEVQGGQKKGGWLTGGGKKPDEVGERILRGEFLMD